MVSAIARVAPPARTDSRVRTRWSPQARGLFHKAILQSSLNLQHTRTAANQVTEAILADIGLTPREAGRLREIAAAELLDIQARVTPRERGGAYRPVIDGR